MCCDFKCFLPLSCCFLYFTFETEKEKIFLFLFFLFFFLFFSGSSISMARRWKQKKKHLSTPPPLSLSFSLSIWLVGGYFICFDSASHIHEASSWWLGNDVTSSKEKNDQSRQIRVSIYTDEGRCLTGSGCLIKYRLRLMLAFLFSIP